MPVKIKLAYCFVERRVVGVSNADSTHYMPLNAPLWFQPVLVGMLSLTLVGFSVSHLSCEAQTTVQSLQSVPRDRNDFIVPNAILQDVQNKSSDKSPDKLPQKPASSPLDINHQNDSDAGNADATLHFEVRSIRITGITYLKADEYIPLVHQYEGKELTFSDLQELAGKITDVYQAKGYVTSRIIIPEQEIEQGFVRLEAIEGILGKNKVVSGRYYKARAIVNRLNPDHGEPLDINTLKTTLRRINHSSPDLNIQATLKAGQNPKESDIDYTITDHHPWHLMPFYDNLGRKVIGRQRYGASLMHNNLLGFGDTSATSLSFSRGSLGLGESYNIPLGEHGTTLGFDYGHSRIKLREELEVLNVKGTSSSYTPHIQQEFINTERTRFYGELAFDVKKLHTTIFNNQRFATDELRVLRPSLNLEQYGQSGITSARGEVAVGLDILGATNGNQPLASRQGAGSQFSSYSLVLTRLQKLPLKSYAIFRGLGQYSANPLVAAQQFQIGGAYTVRGYTEGRLIGDSGFILSAEWRVPCYLIPKDWKLPRTTIHLRDNIQLTAFSDMGAVYTNQRAVGSDGNDYIWGVGAGVRARLSKYMVARLDLGMPIWRQAPDRNELRFHFGLQSELF